MSTPLDIALDHLLLTINDPWESVDQALRENPSENDAKRLGDPTTEGTGAWHLWHTLDVFRHHATCVVGEDETGSWPALPDQASPPAVHRDFLLDDARRFVAWCRERADELATATITHGDEKPFSEMLAMMTRHVVWHAAAIHYWARWKSPRE